MVIRILTLLFLIFQERIHEGNEFMKHLIVIVTFSSTKKLYALETPMECLNSDFIEVHAQVSWVMKFHTWWVKIKAELMLLKPHPFICQRSFISKIIGNERN
jgi:hypothetical protein